MPNIFTNSKARNVTTVTTIYTVPSSTTTTLIGLRVTNVDASATIDVTVDVFASALAYNLQKDTPILPGSALEVIDGAKIVLLTTEAIRVTSTGGNCDVILSYMEQT